MEVLVVPSGVKVICGDALIKVEGCKVVDSFDFNVEIHFSNLFLLLSKVVEYVESEIASSAEQISTSALLIVDDWDLISSYFLIFVEIEVKLSTNKIKSAQDIAEDLCDLLLLLAEEIALATLVIASTIVSYLVILILISDWVREAVVSDFEETIVVTGKNGKGVENFKVVCLGIFVVSCVVKGDDEVFTEEVGNSIVEDKTVGVRFSGVKYLVVIFSEEVGNSTVGEEMMFEV